MRSFEVDDRLPRHARGVAGGGQLARRRGRRDGIFVARGDQELLLGEGCEHGQV